MKNVEKRQKIGVWLYKLTNRKTAVTSSRKRKTFKRKNQEKGFSRALSPLSSPRTLLQTRGGNASQRKKRGGHNQGYHDQKEETESRWKRKGRKSARWNKKRGPQVTINCAAQKAKEGTQIFW